MTYPKNAGQEGPHELPQLAREPGQLGPEPIRAPPGLESPRRGDHRQRDVFPLPLLPVDGRRHQPLGRGARLRAAKGASWREWCNEGLTALNWLHCGKDELTEPKDYVAAPAAQAASVDYLAGLYRDFELPTAYSERGRDCDCAIYKAIRPFARSALEWRTRRIMA